MSYSKLLKKAFDEKNYSFQDVVDKCSELGLKIDRSYINKIASGKMPPPSAEISRILAQVCEIDPKLLVIEGHIEKAPEEVQQLFFAFKKYIVTMVMGIFSTSDVVSEEEMDFIDTVIESMPISEFVLNFFPNDTTIDIAEMFSKTFNVNLEIENEDNNHHLELELKEPLSFDIYDNSMYPTIPEHSKIFFTAQPEYKNGDILLVSIPKEEIKVTRQATFNDNKIILSAFNTNYPVLIYPLSDVIILGKVTKYVVEL